MNSSTIRWLIDAENGGPPRAFECLLCPDVTIENLKVHTGKVTRTLSGMRAHQRLVHRFRPQADLFEEENHAKDSEIVPTRNSEKQTTLSETTRDVFQGAQD